MSDHPNGPQPTVADAKADWKFMNLVVTAERSQYARTGHYTADWTTLTLREPALLVEAPYATDDVDIELADGRRGAVLRYHVDHDWQLSATLEDGRVTARRCTPIDWHCPALKGVQNQRVTT